MSWTVLLTVALLCGFATGACKGAGAAGDSKLEAAKLAISMQPDLEVVAVDRERGIITVRTKSTGQIQTVRAEDIREGQPLPLRVSSGTTAAQSAGEDKAQSTPEDKSVTIQGQGPGGATVNVRSDGSFTASTADGQGQATFDAKAGRVTANQRGTSATVDTGQVDSRSAVAKRDETQPTSEAQSGRVTARGSTGASATVDVGQAGSQSGSVRIQGRTEDEGTVKGTVRPDGSGRIVAEDEEGTVSIDLGAGGVRVGGKSRGTSASKRLREMPPVRCTASQVLELDGVHIRAEGDAVTATAGCMLTIKNSVIESDAFAVVATAGSQVEILDAELNGGAGALSMHAGTIVEAEGTTFNGGLKKKGGSFTDRGGNSFR